MMKKTAIALALASFATATATYAAPQKGTFYTGAGLGWSQYHDANTNLGMNPEKKNRLGADVFVGHQLTSPMALELRYDYLNDISYKSENGENTGKFKSPHVMQLTAKAHYPIIPNLDAYVRGGGAFWLAKSTANIGDEKYSGKKHGFSPVLAAGLEYALSDRWATRLDYQWINNIGSEKKLGVRPDNTMLSLGAVYRFGQGRLPLVPVPLPLPAPLAKTKHYTLKSDVQFGFDKATLTSTGKEEVGAFRDTYTELKAKGANVGPINIIGYTDPLGNPEYNQKLAQRRADEVVKKLKSESEKDGISLDVKAKGMGATTRWTQDTCRNVSGRNNKILCLQPDRVVTIEAEASMDANKEVTTSGVSL